MSDLKTILITGGNLGLGYECAKFIAKNNPEYFIVIASRNSEKTNKAVKEISEYANTKNITGMNLDLGSIKSINNFLLFIQLSVMQVCRLFRKLNILKMVLKLHLELIT